MNENSLTLNKTNEDEVRFIFFKECKDQEKEKAITLARHAIIAAYKNNIAAHDSVYEFYVRHPGCLGYLFQFYKELLDKKRKDFVIQFIQTLVGKIFEFYKIDYKKDIIDSSYETNLPFLRTVFYLGTLYHTSQDIEKAIAVYEKLITLDPEDLIGTRYALVRIYLKQRMYKRTLQLCDKYADDETPIIMYGRALSLIKEGNIEKAKATLKEAIRLHPLIALNLIQDTRESPEKDRQFILQGGTHEASLYMQYYKEFWDNDARAILEEFKDEILSLSEKKKQELINEAKILDALDNIRKKNKK